MATHSSILAWRIPWTGEPGGLQFTGGRETVGRDRSDLARRPATELQALTCWFPPLFIHVPCQGCTLSWVLCTERRITWPPGQLPDPRGDEAEGRHPGRYTWCP